MTQDTAHMPLDERGLQRASLAIDSFCASKEVAADISEAAIRAYLQTAATDVSGLVDIRPGSATKIWFDTEFIEDGKTIDLLSIGLVREDGATYYAEPAEADRSRADAWVSANVIPHLTGPIKPRSVIAKEIVEFAGPNPEFWAYYADYDWVAICQLFGRMIGLPDGWPMFCRDLQQIRAALGVDLPEQKTVEHNALTDALWTKEAWEFLRQSSAASTLQTLSARNAALEAENERLREALKEHVTENVWNAYHIGIERDGRWMDGARSEGEWLAAELSLPSGWNDASLVKSMLPGLVDRIIARAALSAPKGGQDHG